MNTTWLCDCSIVMLRWNQFQFKNWHLLTMKYLNWDLTIQQRGRLWKGRWKIDFASFRTFSRLSQVARLFKRRKFMLQLKRRNCARVQTETVELIALPFPFSSENLAIWCRICKGRAMTFTQNRDVRARWLFFSLKLSLLWRFCYHGVVGFSNVL